MLQPGEKVIYGTHGVCSISGTESVAAGGKSRLYYVLQPIQQEGSRYLIPTDNSAALSRLIPLISATEWDSLLASPAVHSGSWISDENQRKQSYKELTTHGSRTGLLTALAVLYDHRKAQKEKGRKVHICDEIFLRDTEKMLAEEIADVFELDIENAKRYLQNKLKVGNPE